MPPHNCNGQWWEITNSQLGYRLRPDEIAQLQDYDSRLQPSHRRRNQTAYTTPRDIEFEYTRRHYPSALSRDHFPHGFILQSFVVAGSPAEVDRRRSLLQSGRDQTETQTEGDTNTPADNDEVEGVASPSPNKVKIETIYDTVSDSDNSPTILTPSSTASMNSIDEILQFHNAHFEDVDDDDDMGEESEAHVGFGGSMDDDEVTEELDEDGMPKTPFNPIAMGLKEINGLAHFRVSSFKPGNGVEELVNDDIDRYWQSDGVQPHRMTISFVKRVEIRALRFYVDYTQDESYTPTRINWFAGTSLHDLLPFGTSQLVNPAGWIDVPLAGTGGGEDGNSLMAYVVQMQIVENHQNGKDTHIRGVKIYGFDDQLRAAGATGLGVGQEIVGGKAAFRVDESKDAEENERALIEHVRGLEFEKEFRAGDPSGTASTLDFMEDPVIR